MGCFLQLILFAGLLAFTVIGNALLLPGVLAVFLSRMASGAVSRSDILGDSTFRKMDTVELS
ncbi:hypothetical protein JCM19047_1780 [Bacillus sp. JCM 19047]|nr:hypothetical protein JCM19047_1780 [Bacillus sp. JCM 19047]